MSRHLVLVGGGHVHLETLANLAELTSAGHRVTLVSAEPFHPYSGMGPGVLGGFYREARICFDLRAMAQEGGARFVAGRVRGMDPRRQSLVLEEGEEIGYDLVSFNIGSEVPLEQWPGAGDEVVPVKPIRNLGPLRRRIENLLARRRVQLLVTGGGPAGFEVAGNLRRLVERSGGSAGILLVAGGKLLPGSPVRARRLARASLVRRGVEIVEGTRIEGFEPGSAVLGDGRRIGFDLAVAAIGVRPPFLFRDSGLATGTDGGLLVNRFLQSVDHPGIFGGGDCISFQPRTLDRVGVHAVRQGPVLRHNLRAALEGRPLRAFEPQTTYMLIFNPGDGRGILQRRGLTLDGPLAFRLKNWIDQRFVDRYRHTSGSSSQGVPR